MTNKRSDLMKITAVILAALLALSPGTAQAQLKAPSGILVTGAGYWASQRLGGGQGVGGGGALVIGASPRVTLEPSWVRINDIQADGSADPRKYNLDIASASLRARVAGNNSGVDLIVGAGALVHRLEASGGSAKETKVIPFFAPGLAIRQRLGGPLYFELSGRAPMLWTREGELSATPGERKFGIGADIRAGLSILFRRTPGAPKKLPVETTEGFQPTEAGSVAPRRAPETAVSPIPVATRYLTTFYFDEGEAAVKDEYRDVLRRLAEYLRNNPAVHLDLVGFTENRQDRNATRQQVLAESRGTNLKSLLVRIYGAPADRIEVSAVGADFDTPNVQLARRVEAIARSGGRR